MSWIVNAYFLNLAPLDTLHPLFFRTWRVKAFPKCFAVLFYSRRPVVWAVGRSESCLIPVIPE
ncbi:hypothetical protein E1K68_23855 [Pseudomonas sp. B2021]|nr:hypothetical protein CRN80_14180 [Pseudomonas sp. FDAARGOS_380]KAA6194480.1 hypothetical protein F3K52_14985 [Pseudomonas lactis]MBR7215760.1 hypothetical protein [Pseudomonas sp. B2021]NCE91425.1 hypothetical protein [Pseudomonas sp. L13]OWQ40297.1 hypothetical protein CDH05_17290 [Pseudomonas lactis]